MCQTCVDEGYISQSAFDLIEIFDQVWPDACDGPAHVVITDGNANNGSLIPVRARVLADTDRDPAERAATIALIDILLMQPESVRAPRWAEEGR